MDKTELNNWLKTGFNGNRIDHILIACRIGQRYSRPLTKKWLLDLKTDLQRFLQLIRKGYLKYNQANDEITINDEYCNSLFFAIKDGIIYGQDYPQDVELLFNEEKAK